VPILIVKEIIKRELPVPGLGKRIKQTQMDSGASVEKVIRSIDISRTYWNKIVSDEEMTIALDLLRKIEAYFNVDFGVKFEEGDR
jgi:transcriptional regulator with XRE-family HTH domain